MKLSPRTKTGVPGRFQKALPMVASVAWNLQVLAALTSLMRWQEGFASQLNYLLELLRRAVAEISLYLTLEIDQMPG